MALVDRLAGLGDPEVNQKLPVLTFWAMLYELGQGTITKADVVSRFALTADEQVELDWLIGRYNAQPNSTAKARFVDLMQVIFLLAEDAMPGYQTNAQLRARIDAI